jgi:tRNA A37 methylthiotransferase MiaB
LDKSVKISAQASPLTFTKTELSKGFKANYKLKTIDGARTFIDLLDTMSQVDPEMRVRFTSPHPKDFPDHLLQLIRDRPNICKTMHLPAQSGSTACLERMRRGYSREAYLDLVSKIKETIPDIALTSDFIAGTFVLQVLC